MYYLGEVIMNANKNFVQPKSGDISLEDFIQNHHSEESQKRILEETNHLVMDYKLALIRKELEVTQVQLSEALGITQPTLSGFEKMNEDMKVSTMKKYIEALGGKVSISVSLPTGKTISMNL